MISDVLKCCQSNLVALPFVSKLKSNKCLRWLNCCFKQSVFSACPRQTSGRLVLMFTNRTRWQSLKRDSLESLTPACVSAGKHTDSIHLLTYYLHYDCSQWSIVFYLLCWFCHFALVIQWLDHTGRSVYVFAVLNGNQVIISCLIKWCTFLFIFFLWHVNRNLWACIYLAPDKIIHVRDLYQVTRNL